MVDKNTSYEELQGYFQLEAKQRRNDFKAQVQDDKILSAVTPKVVTLDVANPVFEEHRFKLEEEDAVEEQALKFKHQVLVNRLAQIKEESDAPVDTGPGEEQDMDDV